MSIQQNLGFCDILTYTIQVQCALVHATFHHLPVMASLSLTLRQIKLFHPSLISAGMARSLRKRGEHLKG
jgi:hypothetical protein